MFDWLVSVCERERLSESTHLPACRNQFTATAAAATQFTLTPGLVARGSHRLRGAAGTDSGGGGGGLSSSIAT